MSGKSHEIVIYGIPPAESELPGKDVVGSKAHNLMRMARCGLPVPSGFVLSTDLCRRFQTHPDHALDGLDAAVGPALVALEKATGRKFGAPRRPLLLSVRSGAAISMPGMMETVLNIGLSREAVSGLVRMTGNPRLAYDCRRRLIQQYGEVVLGIRKQHFEQRMAQVLAVARARDVAELASADLKHLATEFEAVIEAETGKPFPEDPQHQLRAAIAAVLRSWSSERAKVYRHMNGIPESLGTAVTVQAMVFGNIGPDSGAGVGFTRNPADGRNDLYVDFAANAQGEDVVAGRHRASGLDELAKRAPAAYRDLVAAKDRLEHEFRDMQDFEFTVENGQLHLLQARSGKRTPLAAVRIATDLVAEGRLTPSEAVSLLQGVDLEAAEESVLQLPSGAEPLVTGTTASIGVAQGAVCFDPARLSSLSKGATGVVLVRQAAETEDVAALAQAAALITVEGARTSHAAVVARQLAKPCVVGCRNLSIDPGGRHALFGAEQLDEGTVITVDANEGRIYLGRYDVTKRRPAELIGTVEAWRAVADDKTPDKKPARSRTAQGRRAPGRD